MVLAVVLLGGFCDLVLRLRNHTTGQLTFVAPVQQAGSSATLSLLNVQEGNTVWGLLSSAWPILLLAPVWILAWARANATWKGLAIRMSWVLLAWAALRGENGGLSFVGVLVAFVLFHAIIPILMLWWRQPPEKDTFIGSRPAGNGCDTSTCRRNDRIASLRAQWIRAVFYLSHTR